MLSEGDAAMAPLVEVSGSAARSRADSPAGLFSASLTLLVPGFLKAHFLEYSRGRVNVLG